MQAGELSLIHYWLSILQCYVVLKGDWSPGRANMKIRIPVTLSDCFIRKPTFKYFWWTVSHSTLPILASWERTFSEPINLHIRGTFAAISSTVPVAAVGSVSALGIYQRQLSSFYWILKRNKAKRTSYGQLQSLRVLPRDIDTQLQYLRYTIVYLTYIVLVIIQQGLDMCKCRRLIPRKVDCCHYRNHFNVYNFSVVAIQYYGNLKLAFHSSRYSTGGA
jgi:hypothetical protein